MEAVGKGLKASVVALFLFCFVASAAASVNSVDTITFEEDGQKLHIGYTSSFTTDEINVYLGESEIESETGAVAEVPITFGVSHQETYAKYPTQDTGLTSITGWDAVHTTVSSKQELWDWVTTNCVDTNDAGEFTVDGYGTTDVEARASRWYDYWAGTYKYDIYCWQRNGYHGAVADIGSPNEIFRTEWRLQAGDKNPQTAVITNGVGGAGRTSNLGRHATIRWDGSLTTGENPPLVDDELALHKNSFQDGWRIISERRYDEYRSFVQNNAYDLLGDWGAGRTTESHIESELNGKAEQAASEFSESPLSDAEVSDSSWESGSFKLDMDREHLYPMFDVEIDAGPQAYATIYRPVGEPEIVSTSSAEFGEIGDGMISVDVKNAGEEEGSFSARIDTCGDYFSGNSLQNTKTVSPGETVTFDFRVSFTSTSLTQSEFSDQCKIVVEDTGSGEEVSTSIQVTATQEDECTTGEETKKEKQVGGETVDVIKVCTNGLKLEEDEVCSADEEARYINDDVQYECRAEGSKTGAGGGQWTVPGLGWKVDSPASDLKDIWSGNAGAITYFQLFLSFIAFLGGFALVGIKLGGIIDGLTTEFIPVSNAVVRLVIGLVGGGLAFLMVYQFVTDPIGFILTIVGLIGLGYLYISASTPDINL